MASPHSFPITPLDRFAGPCQPVRRPKEFTSFSYDASHEYRQDDSSLKYYYPPEIGADLSRGFQSFVQNSDSKDEHLVGLLRAIQHHEEQVGRKINVNMVTWRGMMTKILAAPYDRRDGFEMNATSYQDCIFIEENHAYKAAIRQAEAVEAAAKPRRHSREMMSFWGYKFETLSTLPAPWAETSRGYIEGRDDEVVNSKEQYCSVVRTGIGSSTICLGGEVDAIWDSKPTKKGDPINWVELKTAQQNRSERDLEFFRIKLMKFWIQSFLLGVPKIIIGYRTRDGTLCELQELETVRIPEMVKRAPQPPWDADTCVNFAAEFLEWLRATITDEGVWRIKRRMGDAVIEVFKVEEAGHGDILTDEFVDWRARLASGNPGGAAGEETISGE